MWDKSMPPTRTVQQIITELNAFEVRTGGLGTWSAVEGVQTLTSVRRVPTQGILPALANPMTVQFDIGTGVLVKGFINSQTGEIKLFPAKLFGFPEQNI